RDSIVDLPPLLHRRIRGDYRRIVVRVFSEVTFDGGDGGVPGTRVGNVRSGVDLELLPFDVVGVELVDERRGPALLVVLLDIGGKLNLRQRPEIPICQFAVETL